MFKTYVRHVEKGLSPPTFVLVGPPGVGKSEAIMELGEELAATLGRKFVVYEDRYFNDIVRDPSKYFVLVDLRLSCHEPSDLTGIPREVSGSDIIMFKPVTWALVLSRTAGILFLDELTNVSREDLLAVAYRVLLDRYLGYVKLSREVLVVAAGNRPEDAPIAHQLPAPLVNRCIMMYIQAPKLEEWVAYMRSRYRDNWCFRVYTFLRSRPDLFYQPPGEIETLENFPTPRSWTRLALTLGKDFKSVFTPEEVYKICVGTVGGRIGPVVAKYLLLDVPTLEELLQNPKRWKTLDLDVKLNFVSDLASYIVDNFNMLVSRDGTLDPRVSKLLSVILDDSEEIGLTFLQLIPENMRPKILTVFAVSVPEVGALISRLESKRREIERMA